VLFDPVKRSGIAMLWNSQSARPVALQLELLDRLYGLPRRDWLGLDKAQAVPVSAQTVTTPLED
jgi:beta-lactamase class C